MGHGADTAFLRKAPAVSDLMPVSGAFLINGSYAPAGSLGKKGAECYFNVPFSLSGEW
jgi:hypothetical protein